MVRALRVALANFSAAPWRGLEKSERGPSLASLSRPQAAVGSAAFQVLLSAVEVSGKNPWKTKKTAYKKLSLLVRIRGLEPPPSCPD